MKEEINLLPPKIRQVRVASMYLKSAGRLFRLLIMSLSVLLLITLAAWGVARAIDRIIADKATHVIASPQDSRQQIDDINKFLQATDETISRSQPQLIFVADILKELPPGLQLTSIALDEITGHLTVSGQFQSREAVVTYQRHLEALPQVASVIAPLSNFKTGSQATFSFSVIRQNEV